MRSLIILFLYIALGTCLIGQTDVIISEKEKTVSVNINQDDKGLRTVTVTTTEDGEEKIIEWTDNGVIPDDIKKKLEAEQIDIAFLKEGDASEIRLEVDNDIEVEEHSGRAKKVVIKKSENGDVERLEWDGSGDMPTDIKELLEEHDIDIDELHEEHDGDGPRRKRKMRIAKEEHKTMGRKSRAKGRQLNKNHREQYKIITKDEDGNEKVMEWDGTGEMPEDMKELEGEINVFKLDGKGKKGGRRGSRMMFIADDDVKLSDAYMGAQIESTDNGARIIDVMKDSPADKAGLEKGDIVQKVNGARARSMDGLLSILNFFDPNDTVELNVLRDGKEKSMKMTLGKRPDAYR